MRTKKTKAATGSGSGRGRTAATPAESTARETDPAARRAAPKNRSIEFRIAAPTAQTVALAGTFNRWDPKQTPLRNEGGVWHVALPLRAGRYEYRFVVDGRWQEDPAARESAPNPFGSSNSVVVVPAAPIRGSAAVATA